MSTPELDAERAAGRKAVEALVDHVEAMGSDAMDFVVFKGDAKSMVAWKVVVEVDGRINMGDSHEHE